MSTSSLLIMIQVARKLNHCDISQLTLLITKITNLLIENEKLNEILFKGICFYHSKIKENIFNQIQSILPKQLNINDTITQTELIEDDYSSSTPLTFLQTIPKHLRIRNFVFQFLNKSDINILSQVCRSFCVDIIKSKSGAFQMSSHSLLSIIQIIRKWKQIYSNVSFLCQQIINIFIQDDQIKLLKNILLKGICSFHSKLQTNTLQRIESILPNTKQLEINDSITLSEVILNPSNKQHLTLLQIPTDLKICLFQYLHEYDIYSLEKTCRSICIDARNPNCLTFIEINSIFNINKYTQNERYSRLRSLSIDFDGILADFLADFLQFKILPMLHSFNQLQKLTVSLVSFLCTENQFDNFLTLFYGILATGKADKFLDFQGTSWNISSPVPRSAIFDNNYNNMAASAILNIKSLYIEGWTNKRDILQNIFSAVADSKHNFDFIEVYFNFYDTWNEFEMNWNWNLYDQIAKKCKYSKLKLQLDTDDNDYGFEQWIDRLIEHKFFTEFELIVAKHDDGDGDWNDFTFIRNDIRLWLKMNECMMKKIGMKYFKVTHVYHLLDDEILGGHELDGADRESWNQEFDDLSEQLDQYCIENNFNNISYHVSDVYNGAEAILLNVSYHKQLKMI